MAARAEGGAGMALVDGRVHPTGVESPHLPVLWEDERMPGLRRMVQAVKLHGARFGVQLMHGGRQSCHRRKVAPSAIPAPAQAGSDPPAT